MLSLARVSAMAMITYNTDMWSWRRQPDRHTVLPVPLDHVRRFTLALLGVAAITLALWSAQALLVSANLVLCYVPLVVIVAIRLGRSAALVASVAAFLAYNFFFVPPLYTLVVERPQDILELVVFLGISLLVGSLAARQRTLAAAATRRAEQMTTLYQLSREISAATDIDRVLSTVAATTQRLFQAGAIEIEIAASGDTPAYTCRMGTPIGPATLVQPIGIETTPIGELRMWDAPPIGDAEMQALLTTIANHTAIAVERRRSMAAVLQTKALREADRLKSALLSSVSHDLRTPLAVIKGSASNLLDDSVVWDATTQRLFAQTIVSEADRLNRLMRNLFEMSRLEAGAIHRRHALVDIDDVIGPTIAHLKPLLAEHQLVVRIAPDLPPAPMDAVQIELVLSNLLENAAKFGPPHTTIEVAAERRDDALLVSVADHGPGVPVADRTRIFEKFFRAAAPELGPGGTGLGLAICHGIIEAHGGRIWVDDQPGGGAILRFTLPLYADTTRADRPAQPALEHA